MHGTPNPYGPPPPPMPGCGPTHARQNRGRAWVIVALALVALAVIAGIAGVVAPDDEKPVAATTTPPSTSSPAAPFRRAVPRPTDEQARTYLATLARIDPGLVANRERAIRRARNICDYGLNHQDGLPLPRYVVLELSGGNATINEQQAGQVIRAVKVWCR